MSRSERPLALRDGILGAVDPNGSDAYRRAFWSVFRVVHPIRYRRCVRLGHVEDR